MKTLIGKNIYLRALEPEDLTFLFENENDEVFWNVSQTIQPFSKYILKKYIENSHLDIYEVKQLRLIIALIDTHEPVGMIDLYDYNPKNKRAGIGILILEQFQGNGYASEALKIIINYAFKQLDIYQLYASIGVDNLKSIELFEKAQFKISGIKIDWNFYNGKFHDELFLQLINN